MFRYQSQCQFALKEFEIPFESELDPFNRSMVAKDESEYELLDKENSISLYYGKQ